MKLEIYDIKYLILRKWRGYANFILISIIFVLTACGTARTLVMEPVHSTNKYTNLMLVADNPTVDVPVDIIRRAGEDIVDFTVKQFSPNL